MIGRFATRPVPSRRVEAIGLAHLIGEMHDAPDPRPGGGFESRP